MTVSTGTLRSPPPRSASVMQCKAHTSTTAPSLGWGRGEGLKICVLQRLTCACPLSRGTVLHRDRPSHPKAHACGFQSVPVVAPEDLHSFMGARAHFRAASHRLLCVVYVYVSPTYVVLTNTVAHWKKHRHRSHGFAHSHAKH